MLLRFTNNEFKAKISFPQVVILSVFVATYIWIESKVLDTGIWNVYNLFSFILSIFLGMESTS